MPDGDGVEEAEEARFEVEAAKAAGGGPGGASGNAAISLPLSLGVPLSAELLRMPGEQEQSVGPKWGKWRAKGGLALIADRETLEYLQYTCMDTSRPLII